ncbi:hypothetical protein EVAR_99691_1 [Eumeta japonica]|uniref:Uncharacterized protein n=1 Tax=Eumeta variegata TaxID=151549 RepID=A0A4C1YFE4_EUMVA|nr:hypothetical protein EVAR_99691_1 [Eumeta japonica]
MDHKSNPVERTTRQEEEGKTLNPLGRRSQKISCLRLVPHSTGPTELGIFGGGLYSNRDFLLTARDVASPAARGRVQTSARVPGGGECERDGNKRALSVALSARGAQRGPLAVRVRMFRALRRGAPSGRACDRAHACSLAEHLLGLGVLEYACKYASKRKTWTFKALQSGVKRPYDDSSGTTVKLKPERRATSYVFRDIVPIPPNDTSSNERKLLERIKILKQKLVARSKIIKRERAKNKRSMERIMELKLIFREMRKFLKRNKFDIVACNHERGLIPEARYSSTVPVGDCYRPSSPHRCNVRD